MHQRLECVGPGSDAESRTSSLQSIHNMSAAPAKAVVRARRQREEQADTGDKKGGEGAEKADTRADNGDKKGGEGAEKEDTEGTSSSRLVPIFMVLLLIAAGIVATVHAVKKHGRDPKYFSELHGNLLANYHNLSTSFSRHPYEHVDDEVAIAPGVSFKRPTDEAAQGQPATSFAAGIVATVHAVKKHGRDSKYFSELHTSLLASYQNLSNSFSRHPYEHVDDEVAVAPGVSFKRPTDVDRGNQGQPATSFA